MDLLRQLFSGKKKRFRKDGFNLDLTYVTPRVIAMSIPAEGIHKLYRNSADTVARFLGQRHEGQYLVMNLSGLSYDYNKFADKVMDFPWPDHYPPPIELLFQACKAMHAWHKLDINNVTVVHCRAGKGRTGTLICCYMLFSGRLSGPEEALTYYRQKRFSKGGGVTQPSQVRYVHYFADILKEKVKYPLVRQLDKIQLRTAPHMNGNSCKPFIEIYKDDLLVYSSQELTRENQITIIDQWDDLNIHTIATVSTPITLQGDLLFRLYNWGVFGPSKICRFSLNTAFIPYGGAAIIKKSEIDPYKFKDNRRVSDAFSMNIIFNEICSCSADMELDDRCGLCRQFLEGKELEKWEIIRGIVTELKEETNNSSKLLFGDQEDDVDYMLSLTDIHNDQS